MVQALSRKKKQHQVTTAESSHKGGPAQQKGDVMALVPLGDLPGIPPTATPHTPGLEFAGSDHGGALCWRKQQHAGGAGGTPAGASFFWLPLLAQGISLGSFWKLLVHGLIPKTREERKELCFRGLCLTQLGMGGSPWGQSRP